MALGLIVALVGCSNLALAQVQNQAPSQLPKQPQPHTLKQSPTHLQSEPSSLQGTWLILRGSFPDSIVELRRLVLPLDSTKMITCYRFSNQGELTLFTYAPPLQKLCANGLPYVNKGEIIQKHHQRQLRVKIQGGYFMAGTFDYDIVYKLIQEPDHLVLVRNKFFKNERCFTCPQQRR